MDETKKRSVGESRLGDVIGETPARIFAVIIVGWIFYRIYQAFAG